MPCTTLLVGKKASFDGSTMIARNEDAPSGQFIPKKFTVVLPSQQPRVYHSVLSHFTVELPEKPLRYTCMPNAMPHRGIWGAAGVNAENVSMTATETLYPNRALTAADPCPDDGIEEAELVTVILSEAATAKEAVDLFLSILDESGCCTPAGLIIADANEAWYIENMTGHQYIAVKLNDSIILSQPNMTIIGLVVFAVVRNNRVKKQHSAAALEKTR